MTEDSYLRYASSVRDELLGPETPSAQDIGHVLLVLSASRGGSSLLYEVLSASPDVLCLAGEHVPFYKLHGFDPEISPDGSDRIDTAEPARLAELGRTIASEVRVGGDTDDPRTPGFARLVALRLSMQWPCAGLSADDLMTVIDDAIQRHGAGYLSAVLARIGKDPGYYDRLDASRPAGPPDPSYCLEEPPFVVPTPRRLPTADELRRTPLLLKAPLDAYRLDVLRAVFPLARFTVVHLTRAPAASINGLYDGWLDRGFFSHRFPDRLAIPDYSDTADWARSWWNFDLPPGWQEYTTRPLAEVCALQWRSVHEYILHGLARPWYSAGIRVRFEDLIGSLSRRAETIDAIRQTAGLPPLPGNDLTPLPKVMTTRPPAEDRWLTRADVIGPAAELPEVVAVADALRYDRVAA